jgi:hypothetical protein
MLKTLREEFIDYGMPVPLFGSKKDIYINFVPERSPSIFIENNVLKFSNNIIEYSVLDIGIYADENILDLPIDFTLPEFTKPWLIEFLFMNIVCVHSILIPSYLYGRYCKTIDPSKFYIDLSYIEFYRFIGIDKYFLHYKPNKLRIIEELDSSSLEQLLEYVPDLESICSPISPENNENYLLEFNSNFNRAGSNYYVYTINRNLVKSAGKS